MNALAQPRPPILPATVGARRGNSIEALEARIAPAANVWIGQVSGLWTDPANWSDGVPTADDDVTINPAGALTITIPTGAQVANSLMMLDDDTLEITGGSLTLTNASTLSNLTFSNGTLNAGPQLTLTGAVSFLGEATIAGKVRNDADFTLTGTPNLAGTIDNVGIFKDSGRLDFSGAGQFNNLAGGIFEAALSGGGSIAAGSVAVPGFFNAGIFRLSQTGSSTFGVPFNTQPGGTVEVTSGTLDFTGGGTWDGANLQIAQGAEVSLTSGTTNLTGLLSGAGQGVFRLGGGTQGASEGGMLLIGAGGLAVNFPNGRFEFSGNATIAGGTLLNRGVMTIMDRPDLKATLDNAGTVQHFGRLDMSDTAQINNLSGGVYEILSVLDGVVATSSAATPGFFNSGTLRHSAAAPSVFNLNFSNLTGGVIEGTSSELSFNQNGRWENTSFLISPGAEITLSGGVVNWEGSSYSGSGGGLLRLGRGTQGASEGGHVTVGAGGATFDFPPGSFEFSGNATLDGGTVNILGQITIADRPDLGTTINNPGTIINRGQLDFGAAGQINNLAGGILELANVAGGAVTNSASAVPGIFNAGTVRLTEAAGATISVPFFNQIGGVIEVTAGTLALHSSGTWEGGNFVVSPGSVVTLNAGDKVWSGTFTGSGGGVLRLGGGTQGASAGGHIAAGAGGMTLNFPPGFFEFSGNASLDGGEVHNLGHITLSGRPDLGTTVNNNGTIINQGQLDFITGGSINNLSGAVIELAKVGGGNVTSGASTVPGILNSGIIRLTEAGISTITVPFGNLAGGTIEVTAGTLALHSDGTWEGANFLIAVGSEVTMNAGDKVWSGTYTGSGGGILRLGGGTQGASAGGLITVSSGGATMNFPPGFFQFTNNANLDGGSIDNQGEISMSVRPNLNLTINNAGTIVDTGGIDFGAAGRINNLPSGTITIANTADGTFASGGLGIFNQGTFVLTTPFNLATSVPFSNTGLVKAGAGTLRITGAVAEIVNGVLTDGTWDVENGASLLITRPFSTNAATLIQHGSGIIGGIGAGLTTNQGTIQLLEASSLTLTRDFTNSGRLVIDSGSLLTASGAFTQTSEGRTEFELAGTQASGEYGRLAIGGAAALDGTAAFVLAEGFTPQVGDSYGLVSFTGKLGAIASYEGTKISRNLFLSPLVSDTSLVINVVDTPANAKLLDGKTPVTFTDADGDTVTIKLKGPGTAQVVLLGDASDNADIDFIAIQASTDKTSLKIAVKRKGAGDGLVGVGSIDAAGVNLKTVSIKGDLGQITVGDGSGKPAVKSLLVAGDFGSVGGVATFSQLNGGVKKFNIGGAFDGGSLQVDGAVGSMAIGGNFEGSPVALALVGSIAENGLQAMVAEGQALPSGFLLAESIRSLKVGGSVKGGAITTSKDMGNVSVFGDLGAALFSGGGMKSVKVVGKVASADPINPATITPRTKIDSLVIGDDVVNARILVGYDKDEQPVNPDAQVGKVVVKGDWIASSLVAGIVDITADGFGRNDVIIAGDTTPSVFSRIASLTIKGAVSGSPAAGDHFGITAQQIGKMKIGGATIPLSNDVVDDVLLDATNGDFRVVEVS